MPETLEQLKKQKEDLEALLASLEEAFNEASITEDNYKQVKEQNQRKLDETNRKIEVAMGEAARTAPPVPAMPGTSSTLGMLPVLEEDSYIRKRGRPKKVLIPEIIPAGSPAALVPRPGQRGPRPAKPTYSPPAADIEAETPSLSAAPAAMEEAPPAMAAEGSEGDSEGSSSYEGIPQPLTEVEGETREIESAAKKEKGIAKLKEDLKAMIVSTIKESKVEDVKTISDKVEKAHVDLEKLRSFVEAFKDERSSSDERFQRTAEEVGELRTTFNEMEGKFSDVEMKVQELDGTVGNLKPQRITTMFQKAEDEMKMYQSTIDKLDDMMTTLARRVNEIQGNLKQLGSLENVAQFSRDIAKKVVEVDNKQRSVQRTSDRLDSVFAELNKRLEEFMLYKAKQENVDQLAKELVRSIDDINTKLMNYAEKNELTLTRDAILSQITDLRKSMNVMLPGPLADVERQISEIKEFMTTLEEQYKSGLIRKEDYEKSKFKNEQKLKELEEKAAKITVEGAETGIKSAVPAAAMPSQTTEEAAQKELETQEKQLRKEEKEQPETANPFGRIESFGSEGGTKPEEHEEEEVTEEEIADLGMSKKERMLKELENSFRSGLISDKAYKSTRRIIELMPA